MNKVKSNALWNELSPENRKLLDNWLFEKNLGCFVETFFEGLMF